MVSSISEWSSNNLKNFVNTIFTDKGLIIFEGRFYSMEEKIYGINCDVSNCVYNRNAKECVAGKINICRCCNTPDCCDETVCKTFKSK